MKPEPAASRWRPELVADGTYLVDRGFQGVPGVIGSFLLVGDGDLVLIESGPSTSHQNLVEGIKEAGYNFADVSRLIVTHIHLDHAGAAGILMQAYPNLRLSVHSGGAPYLIDPGRLLKSATRIYGKRMERLWGEVIGADVDRLIRSDRGRGCSRGCRQGAAGKEDRSPPRATSSNDALSWVTRT